MADCRFLSRFALTADDKKLRIDHSGDGELNLVLDEGSYYWSLDEDETAGQLDFAKQLKDALDDASSATWTVEIVGVDHTDATKPQGSIRLSVSSGTFQIKWSDTSDSTLDPRIMGEAEGNTTDKPAVAASSYVSPFVARYTWVPRVPIWDTSPMMKNLVMSQQITSAGYIDTVHFASIEKSRWTVQFVQAALVSAACAEEDSRAEAAGITVEDPNCSFESWYIDAVTGQRNIRVYSDIEEHSDEDFDGPYTILMGSGVQHDSLSPASRPMPTAADLFNVSFESLESL